MSGVASTDERRAAPQKRPTPDEPVRFVTHAILPFVILLAWGAFLLADAAQPLDNDDTFFHLRFGHEFLTGRWSLWSPGHVSTFESAHWAPTQWLPQVAMAAAANVFGLPGVAWLYGLLSVALLLTWYLVARRRTSPIVAALLTSAATIAASPEISMRPQILSFIATTLTVEMWLSSARTGRRPWTLVPLLWVWAMCHGMWPVGIAIGLAAVLGIFLDQGWRAGLRFLPIPVMQAAAAALTPIGPTLYPAVLKVNGNRRFFSEWAAPNFTDATALIALSLVALVFVLLIRADRVSAVEVCLALGALGAVTYSNRTVPVAAAMIVPLAAQLIGPWAEPWRPRKSETASILGAAALGLLLLAFLVPHTASRPGIGPAWLDPALSALPAGTPVLDDSYLGGYIMWAHPDLDLFEHGYGDAYTQAELQRIFTVQTAGPGWLEAVRASGARVAVQKTSSALTEALRLQGWKVTHSGDDLDFLIAPSSWPSSTSSAGTVG